MSLDAMIQQLEMLEEKAGDEEWAGEFREEMFDEMLKWLKMPHKRRSLGLLLAHLLSTDIAQDAAYQKERFT